jgi:hypothetical protein
VCESHNVDCTAQASRHGERRFNQRSDITHAEFGERGVDVFGHLAEVGVLRLGEERVLVRRQHHLLHRPRKE